MNIQEKIDRIVSDLREGKAYDTVLDGNYLYLIVNHDDQNNTVISIKVSESDVAGHIEE